MNKNIQDMDFCCSNSLLEHAIDNLEFGNEFSSVAIVGDKFLISELLRYISRIEIDGLEFEYVLLDLDTYDYEDLYYFVISGNMEINIEKALYEDTYLLTEEEYIYIQADCNSKILRRLDDGENNIIIFDFEENC
jgi:hypothetical protein